MAITLNGNFKDAIEPLILQAIAIGKEIAAKKARDLFEEILEEEIRVSVTKCLAGFLESENLNLVLTIEDKRAG